MKGTKRGADERGSAAREIDAQIAALDDWRGSRLAELRALILAADPEIVEEVKWRKPSNPAGVPVWSHGGIVCIGNPLKRSVRLTFPKGAQAPDPGRLFNSRRDSATVRAIDSFEESTVDARAVKALVRAAVLLNHVRERKRTRPHRRPTSPPARS